MGWWIQKSGGNLAQGDLLPACLMPVFRDDPSPTNGAAIAEQDVFRSDLIVVTQSCDLENNKAPFVTLCTIHTLQAFEVANPKFARRGEWESVRKGRIEGLHLLASPQWPEDNRASLVADFGHIVSLPIEYLSDHAASLGHRWRLDSPFLEHFSQAFARFFMRVGLPSAIPPFK